MTINNGILSVLCSSHIDGRLRINSQTSIESHFTWNSIFTRGIHFKRKNQRSNTTTAIANNSIEFWCHRHRKKNGQGSRVRIKVNKTSFGLWLKTKLFVRLASSTSSMSSSSSSSTFKSSPLSTPATVTATATISVAVANMPTVCCTCVVYTFVYVLPFQIHKQPNPEIKSTPISSWFACYVLRSLTLRCLILCHAILCSALTKSTILNGFDFIKFSRSRVLCVLCVCFATPRSKQNRN